MKTTVAFQPSSGGRSVRRRTTVSLLLSAALLFSVVSAVPSASAHPDHAASATVADIVKRDRLIFDQEALLNVYRCLFDVDTEIVPGGCANRQPVLPAQEPGVFQGTPTVEALTERDHLVGAQEALLNVYRCLFNIDTQIVPGGCGSGGATPVATEEPRVPVSTEEPKVIPCPHSSLVTCLDKPVEPVPGPVSDPSVPPLKPTGFTPGTTGPGFTVNEHGRIVLNRLMTPEERYEIYIAAGVTVKNAEFFRDYGRIFRPRSWSNRLHYYEIDLGSFNISEERLFAWAKGCISAYEDAGVPALWRSSEWFGDMAPNFNAGGDGNPAWLTAKCVERVQNSGEWNLVVDLYGADPECIYEHLIELLPESAALRAHTLRASAGAYHQKLWWANYCEMRLSHPLAEEDLVLGPFGGLENWTEELKAKLVETIRATFFPTGTVCSARFGYPNTLGVGQHIGQPDISRFLPTWLEFINSDRSCWYLSDVGPGNPFPFTTDDLDALGVRWEYDAITNFDGVPERDNYDYLKVWTQFWPSEYKDYLGAHLAPLPGQKTF